MAGQSGIVPVRYPPGDLALIDAAREIMGETISQFTRSASVALARAILEAAADADISHSSWDQCWIADGQLEQKPGSHDGN